MYYFPVLFFEAGLRGEGEGRGGYDVCSCVSERGDVVKSTQWAGETSKSLCRAGAEGFGEGEGATFALRTETRCVCACVRVGLCRGADIERNERELLQRSGVGVRCDKEFVKCGQ